MATVKTTTLTFRTEPEMTEVLHAVAERECRSIANMMAMLIIDNCNEKGNLIPISPMVRAQ